jgi:hypothetical protein
VCAGRDGLDRDELQPDDPAGRPVVARQPSLQLPPHPVQDVDGRQHPGVPPAPHRLLAVLREDLQLEAGAGQAVRGEVADELLGRAAGGERHGVDPVDRRLEIQGDGELDRRTPAGDRALVPPAGLPVRPRARRTEAGQHVAGRELGERAERADAEAAQQVDQRGRAGRVEGLDRQVAQERR